MEELIRGYKYDTEIEAQAAVQQCNTYYNIPISEESITRTVCEYELANLNSPQFYWISHDPIIETVLGTPLEFNVTSS